MRILVAPDKFKGAATAAQVGAAIAAGLRDADPSLEVDVLPIADGGDGTLDAVLAAGFTAHPVTARGPVGDPVEARIGLRLDRTGRTTALIELAEICGMARLPGGALRPLDAHTGGLGDGIGAALDAGADDLILAVGGSASTDAGLGALIALGARVLDAHGRDVPPGAGHVGDVATIDVNGLDPRLRTATVEIATDVDNPLLGPHGAVAVFGPQKGITPDGVDGVEAGMRKVAQIVAQLTGADPGTLPGGGAAGGTAAVLAGLLGARIVPGAAFVLDLLGVRARMADADLVVTGEGSFDQQSLRGKGPGAVVRMALSAGAAVELVAGRIQLADAQLDQLGVASATSLVSLAGGDTEASVRDCLRLARRAGQQIGERLSQGERP